MLIPLKQGYDVKVSPVHLLSSEPYSMCSAFILAMLVVLVQPNITRDLIFVMALDLVNTMIKRLVSPLVSYSRLQCYKLTA